MARFYLVRHGKHSFEPVESRNFVGHGLQLAPLDEEGVKQAHECCKDERLKECELIIASPYIRAMQTAAILSKNLGMDMEVEIDLREYELDLTYRARSLEELKEIAAQEKVWDGKIPANGKLRWELHEDFKKRVMSVLEKYKNYNKVIAVTHGRVINCLTGATSIPNCSIHEFDL